MCAQRGGQRWRLSWSGAEDTIGEQGGCGGGGRLGARASRGPSLTRELDVSTQEAMCWRGRQSLAPKRRRMA